MLEETADSDEPSRERGDEAISTRGSWCGRTVPAHASSSDEHTDAESSSRW